ncbi:hypothetical protein H257_01637 [Aphanomyces astaci]|uniref:Uncharacterized protein n=1 Tax=Aphanomyces astaci TaxID=112090 RepID=W4H3G4_APHAT|nr:hypothetical protein H257_01637 [Aphanomyces astaci]ETV86442.1 hypothetical protein H257_01637 [Aphanomyces astaci]|eukprot:XP_009823241.1 hypothetical protein H257_01637 [Aphanomyces astaci]
MRSTTPLLPPPPPTYQRACSVVTVAMSESRTSSVFCFDPSFVVTVTNVVSQRSFDVVKSSKDFDLLLRSVLDVVDTNDHHTCSHPSCAAFASTVRALALRRHWSLIQRPRRDSKAVLDTLFTFTQAPSDCPVTDQAIPRKLIVFLFDEAKFDLQHFWKEAAVPANVDDVADRTEGK